LPIESEWRREFFQIRKSRHFGEHFYQRSEQVDVSNTTLGWGWGGMGYGGFGWEGWGMNP